MNRAGFLATGPLLAATTQIARAQTTPVRIGTLVADGFAEPYYADDMGFFSKAGFTVDITPFRNAGEISAAILGGSLDLGIGTPISMANAFLRGIPMVYIAGAGLYSTTAPTIAFVVAANSPLRTAKDFEGKTIAINGFKDPTHLSMMAWLTKNGADPAKVSIIELPAGEAGAAVARGTVSGAVISEPALSAAVAGGETRIFAKCFDAIGPQFLLSGWFTTTDWLKKNTATAKRFVPVIYQTAKWANANHARSAEILQKHSKITDAAVKLMTRAVYAESIDPSMINPTLQLAATYKFTEKLVAGSDLIQKV